jgi:hypothetical protein
LEKATFFVQLAVLKRLSHHFYGVQLYYYRWTDRGQRQSLMSQPATPLWKTLSATQIKTTDPSSVCGKYLKVPSLSIWNISALWRKRERAHYRITDACSVCDGVFT